MSRFFIFPLLIALISCPQSSEKIEPDDQSDQIKLASDSSLVQLDSIKIASEQHERVEDKVPNQDGVSLTQATVIVVQMDSVEIEEVKKIDGEDNFYTAADDLMYYNFQLSEKMDSLKIPVIFSEKDTVGILTPKMDYTLVKDSSFTLFTYFFFDGDTLERKELFELLGY